MGAFREKGWEHVHKERVGMKGREKVLPGGSVAEENGPRTATAGLVVGGEAFRVLGGFAACEEGWVLQRRQRGLTETETVENSALAGRRWGCVGDFEALRENVGLSAMVGRGFPSPTAVWEFLGVYGATGNVPAGKDLEGVYRRAKAMLASQGRKVRVPSDSAGYQPRF